MRVFESWKPGRGRWVVGLLLALAVAGGTSWAQGTHKLFIIQRSTNKNEVHYDAQIGKDGKPAYLRKLYIDVTEGVVIPTVNYVELFGEDPKTGQQRREKIVPR